LAEEISMKCIGSLTRGALVALCAVIGDSALAQSTQSASATFDVQVTVASTCLITAVPLMQFGAYTGAQLDATNTVNITCTIGSSPRVLLDEGMHPASGSGGSAPLRQLSDGASTAHFLSYQLYIDNGRSQVWDSVVGSVLTGNGVVQPLTVFGRLPGGQNVPVGVYSDTITATVRF
jgi:spore coat protein U-like protein